MAISSLLATNKIKVIFTHEHTYSFMSFATSQYKIFVANKYQTSHRK